MKRVQVAGWIAPLVLGAASVALIARSIISACNNYMIFLYWDQWALIDDYIRDKAATTSWTYLFKPHNEHVIATSKALFALDWELFHFTNLPLILSAMLLAFVVAWLETVLVFWEVQRTRLFWMVWLIFSAVGFSLAQWQNLMLGFQPQFNLVLVGALSSIIIALKVPGEDGARGWAWLAALQIAMGFCVFSMGNGIAIPVSVLFLLILLRASLPKCLITAAFSIFYVAIFSFLTHGSGPANLPPRSLLGVTEFFLAMVGGAPFDVHVVFATILGTAVSAVFVVLFVRYLALPWFKERKADAGLAGLFALGIFLFASAAAAAWGRSLMGTGFALASRYATPMLALWMVLFAVPMRLCLTSEILPLDARFRQRALWLAVIAAFGTMAVSTLRTTDESVRMMEISRADRQAAYFAVSNVLDTAELKGVYWDLIFPDPNTMKSFIALLRERHLNIFSPWMGLPGLSTNDRQKLASVKMVPNCGKGAIEDVDKIDGHSWKVKGWISDNGARTPRMIAASDDQGGVLGFTAPLTFRPDIEQTIGARHFRGFLLPLRISRSSQRPYSVVAFFGDGGVCQLRLASPLSE